MGIIVSIKYVALHLIIGGVLGCCVAAWLEWLLWESNSGPGSDHSYDYLAMIVWGIGALLGAIAGAWMACAILAQHSPPR